MGAPNGSAAYERDIFSVFSTGIAPAKTIAHPPTWPANIPATVATRRTTVAGGFYAHFAAIITRPVLRLRETPLLMHRSSVDFLEFVVKLPLAAKKLAAKPCFIPPRVETSSIFRERRQNKHRISNNRGRVRIFCSYCMCDRRRGYSGCGACSVSARARAGTRLNSDSWGNTLVSQLGAANGNSHGAPPGST